MKNEIIEHIHHAEVLEKMYRGDQKKFERSFEEAWPEIENESAALFWKTRLKYCKEQTESPGMGLAEFRPLIIAVLVASFLIKIPRLFGLELELDLYYLRNAALIVIGGLSLYTLLQRRTYRMKDFFITFVLLLIIALYTNQLPAPESRDSVILAYIHLPLFLWSIFALVYMDFDWKNQLKRIDYLKFNGDIAILAALILIVGGLLTGITIGLFAAIEVYIEEFYVGYIVTCGLVSLPIIASFILKTFPNLTQKIAPVIAQLFAPIVLITLLAYLISMIYTGKDPYNDRDFLVVFNIMLLGVMVIIVFAISETSLHKKQKFTEMILLGLSITALIVDIIALSAIVYRLSEYGLTPNRIAATGSNFLIFGNLIWITIKLFGVNFRKKDIQEVNMAIAGYLPVYALWTVFMVFVMPLLFTTL